MIRRALLFILLVVCTAPRDRGCQAGPIVFWASDPVRPDETVVAQGDGLSAAERIEVVRVSEGATNLSMSERQQQVKPLQASDVSVKFALPASLKTGLFAFRVTTKEGQSTPVVLNRPEILWVQGDLGADSSPGGTVRVFGKCLALDGDRRTKRTRRVRVTLTGPRKVFLPAESDCWAARLTLPRDLPTGEYTLRIHNGFGGEVGWSNAMKMVVRRADVWPHERYNVKDFGADSAGQTDSTSSIKQALEKAERNGGGIVYFPRGRYMLSESLTIPRFTVLKGEARELVTLFWTDTEKPLPVLLKGTNSFGIEDLSLYATHYKNFIVGDVGSQQDAGNVHLRRLLVRGVIYRPVKDAAKVNERFMETQGYGGDTVQLGGRNIKISNCDLYGSGRALYLSRVHGGLVANNTFYNGRWGWYCISGSDGLIFENNQIIGNDLMATGGGLNCLDGSTCSQNVYYARNKLMLMHGWDREAMTSDAGGGAYFGKVATAQGRVLTLADEPKWGGRSWKDAGLFILDGKGRGQYRQVARGEGKQVEVDRPWDISPDQTSHISITMLQRNYLLIDNEFSDATCAIQFYGISISHIVAGNKSLRAGGFHNVGLNYYGYQPSWFVQYLDNEIVEGNQGFNGPLNQFPPLDSNVAALGILYDPTHAPLTRCTIIRRNRLRNNARIEVGGGCADTVVEENVIERAEVGIEVGGPGSHRAGEPSAVFLRNNTFHDVRTPFFGPGILKSWLHPVERLLGRLEGGRTTLTERGLNAPKDWDAIEKDARSLQSLPLNDASLESKCSALLVKALGSLDSSARSASGLVETMLGIHISLQEEPPVNSALQSGKGGAGDIVLRATLASDAPEVMVGAQFHWPEGWKTSLTEPVKLSPNGTVELRNHVRIPAGAWGTWPVPVTVDVALGAAHFSREQSCKFGSGSVRDWVVVGPFENRDKSPLDAYTHPPEERLNVKAEYDGLGGKIKWQPVTLADGTLDFSQRMGVKENATAYAVAVLKADEDTRALLKVATQHGVRAWLNGEAVLTHESDQRATLSQAVNLRAGKNILLLMSSVTSGVWQISAEISEEGSGGHLHVMPAAEVPCVAELNPPASPPVAEGELSHAAGVNWRLVYGDTFDGTRLGPSWRTASGTWKVSGGKVTGQEQAFLAFKQKLSAPVRIAYRARSSEPADLSAFWLDEPPDYMRGILIAFAAGGGSRIDINGTNCASASGGSANATPNKWHHVIAQILKTGVVQLFVDDKLAIECRQASPLTGARYPGIWTWGQGEFDDVRIFVGE